jgi:mannose-6-phosphate isomerase-like protein (cupin superfamily)
MKKIIVHPGKRTSYQSHKLRWEHWLIVEGEGVVILNGEELPISKDSKVHVPLTTKHRVANTHSEKKLVFIEVSLGEFDEFDNTRHEDDYGRAQA